MISGKEALIALANGEDIQASINGFDWIEPTQFGLVYFLNDDAEFRLKPQTITINGAEVPKPFKPKEGDMVWVISDYGNGYHEVVYNSKVYNVLGCWRTEEEIKQVVEALRQIFK